MSILKTALQQLRELAPTFNRECQMAADEMSGYSQSASTPEQKAHFATVATTLRTLGHIIQKTVS